MDYADIKRQAMARLYERYEEAVQKVANEFDTDQFVKEIARELQQQKRELVLAVLGVSKTFDRWEVKNGSPLQKYLVDACREQLSAIAQPIIDEELTKLRSNLPDRLRTALRNAVDGETNDYALRQHMRDVVDDTVKSVTRDFVAQMREEARKNKT